MDVQEVAAVVGNTPHMQREQAEAITELIAANSVRDVLELGFRHGVSTCYMAAALEDVDGASMTTVDLLSAKHASPNVEVLLDRLGLRHMVEVHYEPTSYTWRLMRLLEEDPTPRFDLCYLDGAHSWAVDGFAFFLVDRLLRPGGWIVFDDIDWSYAASEALRDADWVRAMPDDEREALQVRAVYELLVRTHPSYTSFRVDGEWAFAQKRPDAASGPSEVAVERVVVRERYGAGALARDAFDRLRRRVRAHP